MQHRRLRTSAALLVSALVLAAALNTGCAGQGATQGSTEWRLRTLEEKYLSFEESRKARDGVVDERLQALEERQAALTARMDGDREADGRRLDALEGDVAGMKSARVASPVAASPTAASPVAEPADAASGVAPVAADDTGRGGRRVLPAPAKAAPGPSGRKAEAKPARPASEKAAYEGALAQLERGKAEDARIRFDDFLATYPNSALVPNALYWKGESLYAQRRYADAIVAFKEVVARFPKHHKAADSLLKTVLTYKQLGDDANVRFHLKALREDYPESSAARLSRQRFPGM